jgi:hypothetical protein
MQRIADNLSAEQYNALTPFIEAAVNMKPLIDSFPPEQTIGPPFEVQEWRALLAAFTNQS